MKKKNKRIALVACALMLLSLSIGAMAEAPATPYKRAMDEGKSASFTAELSWGSPSFLDEDMNKPLALAIGALSVSGFHGTLENGDRFNSVDINVNGTSVLPFDIYMTGESLVINSPLYGGAIEIAQEEVPVLLETIGQIFDEMFADQLPPDMTFTDMIDQVLTTLDEQLETVAAPELSAEASLDEAIEQFGLEDFVAALDAWAEGFTGAPYEGGDIADFGEDVAEVLIYELSRDQIVELFETLLPLVLENETFWRAVIEQQNGFVQADMPPLEELMAQIAEMDMVQQIIDAVPEAIAFTYVEYLDGDGVALLAQAQLSVEEEYLGYLEWIPGGNNALLLLRQGANSIMFVVSTADTITETLGTLVTVEDAFFLGLTVTEDSEQLFNIGVNFSKQTATDEDLYESSSAVNVDLEAAGGIEASAQCILSQTSAGGDQATEVTSLVLYVFDEAVFTFTLSKETGEIGPRFDPASYDGEIAHPAQMDKDTLSEWAQTVVESGLQQVMMRFMGSVPPELFESMPMGAF